ncbi:MAG: hypothetical protein HFI38_06880 [Lachnospiraceae bacterium]|jgi:hypothetical protein|nr:hypothetical protein [Lachnospiraceae bacterium]
MKRFSIFGNEFRRKWKTYQDWLYTQDKHACPNPPCVSWLADKPVMHAERAPGLTCLSALEEGICGSIGQPVNDSKGCGGLMRLYADPQPDEQGEKYGGRRTWGGLAEEQLFDDELQREAERDILERIGMKPITIC